MRVITGVALHEGQVSQAPFHHMTQGVVIETALESERICYQLKRKILTVYNDFARSKSKAIAQQLKLH